MIGFPIRLKRLLVGGICLFAFAFLMNIYNWKLLTDVQLKTQSENQIYSSKIISSGINVFNTTELKDQILNQYHDSPQNAWLNEGNLSYDDSLLVEYVREKWLIPPLNLSVKYLPYNLKSNVVNPSEGQVQSIWEFFNTNMTKGFFIDCGAHDGEYLSNTLWLEKEKGWNGILIEADPITFSKLETKNRRVWLANLCLSPDRTPKMSKFYQYNQNTGWNGLDNSRLGFIAEIKVQCIPLYTILLGLKRNVIDFFSLDIEGMELKVLKTIPFDKILIKTLAVEHVHVPGGGSNLEQFMTTKGYTLYTKISTEFSQDSIFVHNSLLPDKIHKNGIKL